MPRSDRAPSPTHLNGLAHLFEHMVFKGAGGRSTREHHRSDRGCRRRRSMPGPSATRPSFHARALMAEHVALALELIADLVRAPHFDADDLEREKEVVLSGAGEVHRHARRPDLRPSVEAALRRPAARPLGPRRRGEHPRASRRADLHALAGAAISAPADLIVAAAGKVDHGRSGRAGRSACSATSPHGDPAPADRPRRLHRRRAHRPAAESSRRTSPSAFAAARPIAPTIISPRAVRRQAVGGGMSSRLFQQLREERGLAYSV